ncbi:MAG: DUF952 domain-containing protein [Anaerolineales bacterium]
MNRFLFHLLSPADWYQAVSANEYRPPSLEKEGFIHFSAAHQIKKVREALYRDQPNLLLLVVDETRLKSPLRWEPLGPENERFPHLYGPLNLDAVVKIIELSSTNLDKELQKLSGKEKKYLSNIFGKASLGLGGLTLLIAGIVFTRTLVLSIEDPRTNPLSPPFYAVLTMLSILFSFLGGALGLGGLVQEEEIKWSAAGCFLNAVFFVSLCFLAIVSIGAAVE